MILTDIRKYIKIHGRVSIDDLAARFDGDKTAIEGMLETLKSHGRVVELGCGECGGSGGCSFSGPKIYVYVDRGDFKKINKKYSICSSSAR